MKKVNFKADTEFVVETPSLLLEYLLLKLKDKPRKDVKVLLLHGNVFVNGNAITQFNQKLSVGQKVIIKWSRIRDTEHNEILDIIYEDSEIIVINKPSGLLSISTDKEKSNTAYHIVMNYVKRNNPRCKIFVVHRLDRDVSGVLLIAKNENIKHLLQNNWNDLVLVRDYIAVVEGNVEKQSGTVKSWLKETTSQMVYSSDKKNDGKEAVTHYRKLKGNDKYSLLDIHIDTGRKNQIRVHMQDIGHSIVGDKKYGAKTDPLKRLGLHAPILEFKHPVTKKIMHFEAPTPAEFTRLFQK